MKKKSAIVIGVVVTALLVMISLFSIVGGYTKSIKEEQQLLAETPLTEYIYWSSLDKFPRYKVEAARKVEKLMSDGVTQEEACEEAIEEVSDKIYNDTVKFINDNTELEDEDWEEAYFAYIYQTQH